MYLRDKEHSRPQEREKGAIESEAEIFDWAEQGACRPRVEAGKGEMGKEKEGGRGRGQVAYLPLFTFHQMSKSLLGASPSNPAC